MSSADQSNQTETLSSYHPTCMESVNRITKLPVVEQTISTAQNLYGKVKDYNSVTNWTLQTAENTAFKAVEVAKPYATPVIKNFEGPIKKVDDVLCSGLDYVENKVPSVKLPPSEIYNNTKDYYNNHVTPAVESAKAYAGPAVKTAMDVLEPAIEKARSVVDPLVEPIVENVKHRVDEYLHKGQEAAENQQETKEPQEEKQPEHHEQQQHSEGSPEKN